MAWASHAAAPPALLWIAAGASPQTSKNKTANGPNKDPVYQPIFLIATLAVRVGSRPGGMDGKV